MDIDTGSDLQCRLEVRDGRRLIRVEGELCLPALAGVRALLCEALASGGATTLDLAGVSAVDLGGLQLLCSAHRSFERRDRALSLDGTPENLTQAARAAGFDGSCPWAV